MKFLKIIRNIIIGILFVVFFAFAIGMTVLMLNVNDYGLTQFGDTTLLYLTENISSKNFKKGDLVLIEKPLFEEVKVGDELFVYRVARNGSVTVEVGIVGDIHEEDSAISYENGATFGEQLIIGHAGNKYEKIGSYLGIIQSQWGFLFIILVPCFLIFIYQLYALIVEIKYGKYEMRD